MNLHGITAGGSGAPATVGASVSVTSPEPDAPPAPSVAKTRRRTYTGAALARRKEWGKKWGAVGAQWKRENNPRG